MRPGSSSLIKSSFSKKQEGYIRLHIEWANALVPPTPFQGCGYMHMYIYIYIYIYTYDVIICLYGFRLRFSHLNQSMESCSTKFRRIWGHSRALSHVAGLNALNNRGQWPECLLEAAAQRLRHLIPGKRHAWTPLTTQGSGRSACSKLPRSVLGIWGLANGRLERP